MKNVVIPGGGVIPYSIDPSSRHITPMTPVGPKPARITPAPATGSAKPSGRAGKKETPGPVKPTLTKV